MTSKEMPESQQPGGCDYMSFEDAQELFDTYISAEMRDPYGLNDDAKAMLAYKREINKLNTRAPSIPPEVREALEFYANPDNYVITRDSVLRPVIIANRLHAIDALKALDEMEG